ncbi:MAG TPA: hypothetical protein VGF55_15655 [Gemmataceae bacterium]|jgi:hypothetical protein
MDRAMCFLGGAALGAVTMYYFDPDRGRGRRSVCEDQWAARGRRAARYLDKAGRDLANRATGLAHEAGHLIHGEPVGGSGHRPSLDIMHENLAPGTRLLLGALGGALVAWGLMEDAPEACVLGTVGAALALPAVTGCGAACGFGLTGGHEAQPEGQRQPLRGGTPERVAGPTVRREVPAPVM